MSEESIEINEGGDEAETFNLIFFPKIADGEDPEEVRKKLAKTLKVDAEKVEAWFEAEAPTVLLKEVTKAVAEKYMSAILECGASVNIQPSSESGGLALIPKSRNMDFFICPSCEYEEEVPVGTKKAQCPKCGLVIAKWEEKMREEKEKEQIRRRLMRDARHKGDREEELKRKRAELERLRKLEHEIMKELGLKPPGRLWLFFQQHPFSIGGALSMLAFAASAVVLFYVDLYLEELEHQALVAMPPGEEIQQIAPLITAAVQLQQNGNEGVVSELAQVTTLMRGEGAAARQEIIDTAQQMMKGANPEKFVSVASRMPTTANRTLPGPQQQNPVSVNVDTIGGIYGIAGVDRFNENTLRTISAPLLEHGHEKILTVLSTTRLVTDPLDPEAKIVVDEIDQMDGSMIVDLMKTLGKDLEWDMFIAENVDTYLADREFEAAQELANQIRNSAVKIDSLTHIMEQMLFDDSDAAIKPVMTRVSLELDKILDADVKVRIILDMGERLSLAGYSGEPAASFALVDEMIKNTPGLYEKSFLASRLALAYLHHGDRSRARTLFNVATNRAGQITDLTERISAFTRIAQRYYDARNTTLAHEILSEAQILAATRLEPTDRSRVFGEIAVAQVYMGDLEGALASIENAAVGEGAGQLTAKLAESLIGLERYFEADAVMAHMTEPTESARLKVRLISALIHEARNAEAGDRLADAVSNARNIPDPSRRGLILSQLARLHARIGNDEAANALFKEAFELSGDLSGRKQAVSRGLVGLDQARSLRLVSSRTIMDTVTESIVKDPIDSEIIATSRILTTLMPEAVAKRVEEKGEI